MLRTPFASERIQRVDPHTGVRVIQLTAYPTPSAHMLYDWPSITPDNGWVLLFCQRAVARTAPWDLFRVDADGLNLFQLTEVGETSEGGGGYYGRPSCRLTLDGRTVYGVWNRRLYAVDVETGKMEDLLSLEGQVPAEGWVQNLYLAADGKRIFVTHSGLVGGALRLDLAGGTVTRLDLGGYLFACDPTAPRLVVTKGTVKWGTQTRADGSRVITNEGDLLAKWLVDEDGRDLEPLAPEQYAHCTLLGRRLAVQGCGKPPERCIWLAEPGQEPRRLAQGPYFWHSGASWNGEWIAADTNWPDQGLQLVHVASGRFARFCHAGASQDHYEFGHPHPTLSPDGGLCLFRSDRTGTAQLYLAHLSAEFRERVAAGDLAGEKWLP